MRNSGAAKRREQEPPRGGGPIEADLLRVIAGTADIAARLGRHDQAITGIIAKLEKMAAEHPDAGHLAAAAARLRTRHEQLTIELISLAAHNAEAREAAENLASVLGTQAMMTDAWIAEGRRREAAERDAQPRAPRGRHAARSRHLRVAGGIAVTSAAAASLVGPAVIAAQDSAAVHHWSPRPASVRLHADRPDTAVLVPSSAPSARPSAAAASARAAPSVTATPSAPVSTPAPSATVTPPAPPALSVARFLDLGDSIRGGLTLTAGPDAVTWTATTTDGITLSQSGGVLVPGQAVTLQVTDGPARQGWIYISAGRVTYTVAVTSGLGVPALPSGL